MLDKIKNLDSILESMSLDKKSISIILDFIDIYQKTENKEVLKSLLFDILNH